MGREGLNFNNIIKFCFDYFSILSLFLIIIVFISSFCITFKYSIREPNWKLNYDPSEIDQHEHKRT
jgi:hypothetical protein